jgi:hypothetical protein
MSFNNISNIKRTNKKAYYTEKLVERKMRVRDNSIELPEA